MPKLKAVLRQDETWKAAGIEVPAEIVEGFGQGKRPKVVVTINGSSHRSTIAVYDSKFYIGVPQAAVRAAGVKTGQKVDIQIELDTAPREVEVPKDLAAALKKAGVRAAFDALSYTYRKEHVRDIEGAKAAETRARRIDKAVAFAQSKSAAKKK